MRLKIAQECEQDNQYDSPDDLRKAISNYPYHLALCSSLSPERGHQAFRVRLFRQALGDDYGCAPPLDDDTAFIRPPGETRRLCCVRIFRFGRARITARCAAGVSLEEFLRVRFRVPDRAVCEEDCALRAFV